MPHGWPVRVMVTRSQRQLRRAPAVRPDTPFAMRARHRACLPLLAAAAVAIAVMTARFPGVAPAPALAPAAHEVARPASVMSDVVARIVAAARQGRALLSPEGAERFTPGGTYLRDLDESIGTAATVPAGALVQALKLLDADETAGVSARVTALVDRGAQPLAVALGERSTPATDEELLRMLRDADLHVTTRRRVAVALCRPRDPPLVSALVDVVLDRTVDPEVRRAVLVRLPRTGARAPRRLRELLYAAVGRLDVDAAGVLGAMGDLEAPRLISTQFRISCEKTPPFAGWHDYDFPSLRTYWATVAMRRVVTDPPDLVAALAHLAQVAESFANTAPGAEVSHEPGVYNRALQTVVDGLDPWLMAHPAVVDTEFERERKTYRESVGRRREVASSDLDGIAGRPDDEIDVAAAVLTARDPEARDWALDRLDRLASWLRPLVDAAPSPRAKMALLQRELVPRYEGLNAMTDPNLLRQFLLTRGGVCMTKVTAFVSIGDRLGLPLRSVSVPGHIYLRWDDGSEVFNFDPTRRGADIPDEQYIREQLGEDSASRYRDYVRVLDRRGVVSLNLSNSAVETFRGWAGDRNGWADERNVQLARRAIDFDPANTAAWMTLAQALSVDDDASLPQVRDAVAHFYDPLEPDPTRAALAALYLSRAGAPDEALEILDTLPRNDRSTLAARSARAFALIASGHARELPDLVAALRAEYPDDEIAFALHVYQLLRTDEEAGIAALEAKYGSQQQALLLGPTVSDQAFRVHRMVADACFTAPGTDSRAAEIACDLLSPFFDRSADASRGIWSGGSRIYGRARVVGLVLEPGVAARTLYARALRRLGEVRRGTNR